MEVKVQASEQYIADLKRRMEKYKISQNALARQLEKNPAQVSRWFTDNPERKVKPTWDTMKLIEEGMAVLERKARARP
jgi:transcriptional regulator with XRE-family HTH domain